MIFYFSIQNTLGYSKTTETIRRKSNMHVGNEDIRKFHIKIHSNKMYMVKNLYDNGSIVTATGLSRQLIANQKNGFEKKFIFLLNKVSKALAFNLALSDQRSKLQELFGNYVTTTIILFTYFVCCYISLLHILINNKIY